MLFLAWGWNNDPSIKNQFQFRVGWVLDLWPGGFLESDHSKWTMMKNDGNDPIAIQTSLSCFGIYIYIYTNMCTVYEPFVWLNQDFETSKLTNPLRMPSNSTSSHTLNQEVGLSKTFCQGRRFLDTSWHIQPSWHLQKGCASWWIFSTSTGLWFQPLSENMCQIVSLPRIGMNWMTVKNNWNHHLAKLCPYCCPSCFANCISQLALSRGLWNGHFSETRHAIGVSLSTENISQRMLLQAGSWLYPKKVLETEWVLQSILLLIRKWA